MAKKAATSKETKGALEVRSKVESFWRAGRRWTQTAQTVFLADLTEEQATAIYEEPMLSVKRIELEPEEGV